MILSKKWLQDYITVPVSDKDYCDAMTLSGSKVEGYEYEGAELKNIIVGQVKTLEKHPDADTLWICQIDVGQEDLVQIVTGAQNLKEEDYVPVAMHKSTIHGGKTIKKGKLRGVVSNGMLCSLEELGLTINDFPTAVEDGIFVIDPECDLSLGMDIQTAIGLDDCIVEFEITSNRPDCMSVLGLARETAATFGKPFKMPKAMVSKGHGDVKDHLSVDIHSDNCYRYIGAVVENVRIKPSPRWMRERLRASGVRPINNIVDITNYVMLEFGQPMHAFDLRFLEEGAVNVRQAENGETITTLDGEERKLTPEMLVIADAKKPVAVAGVMGGEFSGIMDDTTTIVFESACFNGVSVRKTAKSLGMRTEASSRYEKELDPEACLPAIERALELVQLLDAGDVVNGLVDNYRKHKTPATLPFKPDWYNEFIGIDLSEDEIKAILTRIDCKIENGQITVPTFRGDLECQADISEEVARFYGYHNIPNRALSGVADGRLNEVQKFEKLVSDTLIGSGLNEIATYSFMSPKAYDKICLPEESALRKSVVISNPLGEDTSVMRTTAVPSVLEVLARNYNLRNPEAAVFENATIYLPNGTDVLPDEPQNLVLGMYGGYDFYDLKGILEELLDAIGITAYDIEPVTDNPLYHPGRCAKCVSGKTVLALFGELHPAVQENYKIGAKTYIADLRMDVLFEAKNLDRRYHPLPKFPASTRDLALVCEDDVPVQTLQKTISGAVGAILEEIRLFDIYRGAQVGDGKKSVAFSLKLRSPERTLTDEEADKAMSKAVAALSEQGISVRS